MYATCICTGSHCCNCKGISLATFILFADDTNIYFEAETPEKLESVVNKELRIAYL